MKGGYLFELFTKTGDLTKVWGLVLCVFVTMSTGKKPRSVKMSGRKKAPSPEKLRRTKSGSPGRFNQGVHDRKKLQHQDREGNSMYSLKTLRRP